MSMPPDDMSLVEWRDSLIVPEPDRWMVEAVPTSCFEAAVAELLAVIPQGRVDVEVRLWEDVPYASTTEVIPLPDDNDDTRQHPIDLTEEQWAAARLIGAFIDYVTEKINQRFSDQADNQRARGQFRSALGRRYGVDNQIAFFVIEREPDQL